MRRASSCDSPKARPNIPDRVAHPLHPESFPSSSSASISSSPSATCAIGATTGMSPPPFLHSSAQVINTTTTTAYSSLTIHIPTMHLPSGKHGHKRPISHTSQSTHTTAKRLRHAMDTDQLASGKVHMDADVDDTDTDIDDDNMAAAEALVGVAATAVARVPSPPRARTKGATACARVPRPRTGVPKVPKGKSKEWVLMGIFVASRRFPELPLWIPEFDHQTGKYIKRPVSLGSLMRKIKHGSTLMHVRVVQRIDIESGKMTGEVRYVTADIGLSYSMGNTGYRWIVDHPAVVQVHCKTWHTGLNRQELEDHLTFANSGALRTVFTSDKNQHVRDFLRAILRGKGVPATFGLIDPVQLSANSPANGGVGGGTGAGAAIHTLHTHPQAESLLTEYLQRLPVLWFHPVSAEGGAVSHAPHNDANLTIPWTSATNLTIEQIYACLQIVTLPTSQNKVPSLVVFDNQDSSALGSASTPAAYSSHGLGSTYKKK